MHSLGNAEETAEVSRMSGKQRALQMENSQGTGPWNRISAGCPCSGWKCLCDPLVTPEAFRRWRGSSRDWLEACHPRPLLPGLRVVWGQEEGGKNDSSFSQASSQFSVQQNAKFLPHSFLWQEVIDISFIPAIKNRSWRSEERAVKALSLHLI